MATPVEPPFDAHIVRNPSGFYRAECDEDDCEWWDSFHTLDGMDKLAALHVRVMGHAVHVFHEVHYIKAVSRE